MDIRIEIRRILKEELASLVNPLDAATDSISMHAQGLKDRVQAIKDKSMRARKDMETDKNAKRKAGMIPHSNDQAIERQRRQFDTLKIKDLDQKLKDAREEEEQLDALAQDVDGMSTSLRDMEDQKAQLSAAIEKMSGQAI